MNQNLNYLFVYCTFVPAESSLNAQPSPMRKPLVASNPKSPMNKLSDIDVNKSTEKGYLICKRGWLDKIDRPILAFLFISGMTFTALIFFQFNFNDPRDRNSFAIILLPIIFLFWLYCLYRTIIENRLTCLKTSLNQDQNHELLGSC